MAFASAKSTLHTRSLTPTRHGLPCVLKSILWILHVDSDHMAMIDGLCARRRGLPMNRSYEQIVIRAEARGMTVTIEVRSRLLPNRRFATLRLRREA